MSTDLTAILTPIMDELGEVDDMIKSHLITGVPVIDNSSLHLFMKGGKKIRASLVLLSSGLKHSRADYKIDLAAAVEIIHAASLIHDDIIDKSFLRRGEISVPSKFGDKIAVLAGDYLYAVAVSIAVNSKNDLILKTISEATREMVKGELYQIEFSSLDKINEDYYYSIIDRKTGRLMATSALIGGASAGFSEDECRILYDMGRYTGFAFQIIDDTMDFSESSDVTGKDVGNDFRDGKITLPFIYILKQGTDEERDDIRKLAKEPDSTNWVKVKKLVQSAGAFEYSIATAKNYAQKAIDLLKSFPYSKSRDSIEELINFVVERKY